MFSPFFHATIWLLCAVGWSLIFAVTGFHTALFGCALCFIVGILWLLLYGDEDAGR